MPSAMPMHFSRTLMQIFLRQPQTGPTSSRIFFHTADTGDDHDLTAKATADSALRSRGDIGRGVAIV
jgi:hypothetical protein